MTYDGGTKKHINHPYPLAIVFLNIHPKLSVHVRLSVTDADGHAVQRSRRKKFNQTILPHCY